MTEFDIKAAGWDDNSMHVDRSKSIAERIIELLPLNRNMRALEFGSGTGLTSFFLKDHLKEIVMIDNSEEMVKVMNRKISTAGIKNLTALLFDLEKNHYTGNRFDLILTQMALHHVVDVEAILRRFIQLLNPGGYLAIADLYPEDGSFHGPGFTGHKGFDIEELSLILTETGYEEISASHCYTINKQISDTEMKEFRLFLLIAIKSEQKEKKLV